MSADTNISLPRQPEGTSEDEIDLLDILIVLARNKFFIACITAVFILAAGVGASLMTPSYRAQSLFGLKSDSTNARILLANAAQSSSVIERLAQNKDISKLLNVNDEAQVMEILKKAVSVRPRANCVTVTVEHFSPQFAAAAANAFFDETQKQLLDAAEEDNAALREEQISLEEDIKEMQAKLTQTEEKLKLAIEQSSENTNVRNHLEWAVNSKVNATPNILQNTSDGGISYLNSLRELRTQEILYYALLEKYKKITGIESNEPVYLQFFEKASVPTSPVRPNKKQIITLAGVLGFILALFCAFLREFFRNAANDPVRRRKLNELVSALRFSRKS